MGRLRAVQEYSSLSPELFPYPKTLISKYVYGRRVRGWWYILYENGYESFTVFLDLHFFPHNTKV